MQCAVDCWLRQSGAKFQFIWRRTSNIVLPSESKQYFTKLKMSYFSFNTETRMLKLDSYGVRKYLF